LENVGNIMTTNLITISEYTSLKKVDKIFGENQIHHLPVLNGAKLVGMVSGSDHLFFKRGFDVSSKPESNEINQFRLKTHCAGDIMTRTLAHLAPEDQISLAMRLFEENQFHALPVVEEERLVGILSTHDLIKHFRVIQEQKEQNSRR